MAVRRFPSKTEPNRLNRYQWESIKGFCYTSLRNKRDKDKCSLLVGTSSFESFSETLLKGTVNIGPYTFEVEVPKNNTIWCWTGGREGHFRKICTAQDTSKREKTLRKRKTQLHSENGQSRKSKVKPKGKANKKNRGKRRLDKAHDENGRQKKNIYVLIMYMLVH